MKPTRQNDYFGLVDFIHQPMFMVNAPRPTT